MAALPYMTKAVCSNILGSEMPIEIALVSPPYLEGLAAQFVIEMEGGVAIPVEVFRDDDNNGKLRMTVFPKGNDENWEFDVSEFLVALSSALVRLSV